MMSQEFMTFIIFLVVCMILAYAAKTVGVL